MTSEDHDWHPFNDEWEVKRLGEVYLARRAGAPDEVVCELTPAQFDEWRTAGRVGPT